MSYIANDDPEYFAALQKQKEHDDAVIAALKAKFESKQLSPDIFEYPVNMLRPDHNDLMDYLNTHNVRAVLLTLYHSGTANTEKPEMSVATLVERLREERSIVFFAVTENGEPVDLHAYETSVKLRRAGVVPLYDMPRQVALAKLRLIGTDMPNTELITEMLKNKAGELDNSRIIQEDLKHLLELYMSAE